MTMKAAVFHGSGQPLQVVDVATPEPSPTEVVVRVAGCGMCHTDLHYLDHNVPTFKSPPIILGHEAAGTVAAVGSDVTTATEGDRVLIPAVLSCGRCPYCRAGRENLCDHLAMLGNHIDGAYAEYVAVPASELVPVPDGLSLEQVSIVADAVSTPYHAVTRRAKVRPGETVAVIGCGGVGLNVVQCAAIAGASVIAVDIDPERLELARSLGAATAFDPSSTDRPDKALKKLSDGGVDVAFEVIGTPATIGTAFQALRRGGRLCIIGFSQAPVELAASKIMFYELEVIGSLGCGGGEYPEILKLVEQGRIELDPIVSGTIPLDDINRGFDRMRAGEGIRWVVTP
jgi:6-hydroxycyclohex-1-ene-1-carbonyl-CoA dehydrogenase